MFNSVRGLFRIIRTQSAKNFSIVFISQIISALAGIFGTVLVVRHIDPASYGLLAICLALISLLADYGDLGTSTALVRLVTYYQTKQPKLANGLLFTSFLITIIATGIFIGFGYLLSPLIADLLGNANLVSILRLSFIVIAGVICSNFTINLARIRNSFFTMSIIQVIPGLVELGGILILISTHKIAPDSIITLYIIAFFTAFVIGFWSSPKKYISLNNPTNFGRLFSYSKWILITIFCYGIYRRIDILMLSRYADSGQVGIYAAINQFATPLYMVSSAVSTVLLPRVGSVSKIVDLRKLYWKLIRLITQLAILTLPLLFLGKPLILLLFGENYLPGLSIFPFVVIQSVVSVYRAPLSSIIYALNRPYFYAMTDLGRLVITVGLLLYFLPRFGMLAAAVTMLATTTFFISLEYLYVRKHLNVSKKII